jgi:hypothetical protein
MQGSHYFRAYLLHGSGQVFCAAGNSNQFI